MNKKLSTILTVLVIAMFAISTADAGGGIKLSANPTFSLGSLITDGFLQGTDQTTVTVVLDATGFCKIGKKYFLVTAQGSQVLFGNEESDADITERPFHVETTTQNVQGCSNDPEIQDGFIFWTAASISVFGSITPTPYPTPCGIACEGLLSSAKQTKQTKNTLLVQQNYNCTTNRDAYSVSCTPVNGRGSNKGTVAICHATGNKKSPYVLLTVNVNGLNGHGRHTGDIRPADGCPK